MTMRQDQSIEDWPLRPWIMAAICAAAGLLFHLLTDHEYSEPLERWRQAGATFVVIAAISFVVTVERKRWTWSVAFALGWGLVVAMVGWFTAAYNQYPTIFEWPFLSGIFAVLLAAPLFQTARDEGARRFPYERLHGHAWTDAVIGAASLSFVGITFLLAWLIAGLFGLIGMDFVENLLKEDWFSWMLAGFAFGSAVGLLRERDSLVATLQRLVMVVLGVLAPVLAMALVIFLISLPFTGFDQPNPWATATPLMLSLAAAGVLFANAVIGNGAEDRATNRVLRYSALALVLTVLPLSAIAAYSMSQRIGQYGWTPERIWGVVAVLVAIGYGLAGWWSVVKGRIDFDALLRPLQTRLAIGLCGLALFLALPILDFGSISAQSQLARLERGKVRIDSFDWRAMAFDFGPAGRASLKRIARNGVVEQRRFAAAALAAKSRWRLTNEEINAGPPPKDLIVVPGDAIVPPGLRAMLLGAPGIKDPFCSEGGACRVFPQPGGATFIAFLDGCANLSPAARNDPKVNCTRLPGVFEQKAGVWTNAYEDGGLFSGVARGPKKGSAEDVASLKRETEALERGDVRIVTVTRRQLTVGEKPSGNIFN